MLLYTNDAVKIVPLRGITIVALDAMKPEALQAVRAGDAIKKKPQSAIEGVAKKEVTLQDILNKKRENASYRQGRSPNWVRSDTSGSKGEKLCFVCHDFEHLARECPNPLCCSCSVRGHRSYNFTAVNLKDSDYRRSGRRSDYR